MNTGTPEGNPESFEPQLTAYLLGELDAAEAARVESALAADPALRQLKSELEYTLGLVKEAVQNPVVDDTGAPQEQPQLSPKRREALLKVLRGAPVVELPQRRRESLRWMIPTAIAAAVVGALSLHQIDWVRTGTAPRGEISQAGESLSQLSAAPKSGEPPLRQYQEAEKLVKDRKGVYLNDGVELQDAPAAPPAPSAPLDLSKSERPLNRPIRAPQILGRDITRRGFGTEATPEAVEEANQGVSPNLAYRYSTLPAPSEPRFSGGRGVAPARDDLRRALEPADAAKVDPASTTWEFRGRGTTDAKKERLNELGLGFQPATNGRANTDALDSVPRLEAYGLKPASALATAPQSPTPENFFDSFGASSEGQSGAASTRSRGAVRNFAERNESESKDRARSLEVDPSRALKAKIDSETKLLHVGEREEGTIAGVRQLSESDARAKRQAAADLGIELKRESLLEEATVFSKPVPPPTPQPEVATQVQALSTFSLNVADVSFKLAAASLANGQLPEPGSIRTEEFLNAFQYRDPDPTGGAPLAFAWDRAASPFNQNREFLRFSIRTAAIGREATRPLNLVLLLDKSGSMERRDRVSIVREALQVLGRQLRPEDRLSIITFARTAHLLLDGVPGPDAVGRLAEVSGTTPEGGTNLEEAMKLAYATAARHFQSSGNNRVVLLTDGAANLGDVEPLSLQHFVDGQRQRGIALDCFGIGLEGLNDPLLATLSSHGDGRYGFLNSPTEAESSFAAQLAGALQVAASDVKVQVEFNPQRVASWRQIGYAAHQLTAEQFRDNRVDAAELAGAESGNGLYAIESLPSGNGPVATVRARFREPSTGVYREVSWMVPYTGTAPRLGDAPPRMRLAVTAASFGEWLSQSPFAAEATPARLLPLLNGVPETFAPDPAPETLQNMIRQAQALGGR